MSNEKKVHISLESRPAFPKAIIGPDPVTARRWSGLGEDERRQARAEAERYENLSEVKRDQMWSEGAEAIGVEAEGEGIDLRSE